MIKITKLTTAAFFIFTTFGTTSTHTWSDNSPGNGTEYKTKAQKKSNNKIRINSNKAVPGIGEATYILKRKPTTRPKAIGEIR